MSSLVAQGTANGSLGSEIPKPHFLPIPLVKAITGQTQITWKEGINREVLMLRMPRRREEKAPNKTASQLDLWAISKVPWQTDLGDSPG